MSEAPGSHHAAVDEVEDGANAAPRIIRLKRGDYRVNPCPSGRGRGQQGDEATRAKEAPTLTPGGDHERRSTLTRRSLPRRRQPRRLRLRQARYCRPW